MLDISIVDWPIIFASLGLPLLLALLLAFIKALPVSAPANDVDEEAARATVREEVWFLPPDLCFLASAGAAGVIYASPTHTDYWGEAVVVGVFALVLGVAGQYIYVRTDGTKWPGWILTFFALVLWGIVVQHGGVPTIDGG